MPVWLASLWVQLGLHGEEVDGLRFELAYQEKPWRVGIGAFQGTAPPNN